MASKRKKESVPQAFGGTGGGGGYLDEPDLTGKGKGLNPRQPTTSPQRPSGTPGHLNELKKHGLHK